MVPPVTWKQFAEHYINLKLRKIDIIAKANLDAVQYLSTGRICMEYTSGNCFIVSVSIMKNRDIALYRLELPPWKRGKGKSIEILQALKDCAHVLESDLIIKHPDNKSFWTHYADKYGGVTFQYRKYQRRIRWKNV